MSEDSGQAEEPPPLTLSRFQVGVAALMFLVGAVAYPRMPPTIPIHWNQYGEIDRYVPKSPWSVFSQVFIVCVLIGLFWVLPRIDPFKRSYGRFRGAYYVVIDVTIAFMALVYFITLYASFDATLPVGVLIPVGIGFMFAIIGERMPHFRRNFFVGIRTPWTLASEDVWDRTHRVGGTVFVVSGITAAAGAFLPPPFNWAVFLSVMFAGTMGVVAYSYVLYRRLEREGRIPEAGFEPPP